MRSGKVLFSALALAVLTSTALAGELIDVHMDQITAGGLFQLTADQLDDVTSAPVGPLQRNVIGGIGGLLEEVLSEVFHSQQSLLRDLAVSPGPGRSSPESQISLNADTLALQTTPLPNALQTTPLPNALQTTPLPNARTI